MRRQYETCRRGDVMNSQERNVKGCTRFVQHQWFRLGFLRFLLLLGLIVTALLGQIANSTGVLMRNFGHIILNRAEANTWRDKDVALAVKMFQIATEMASGEGGEMRSLGMIYLDQGKYDEAERAFKTNPDVAHELIDWGKLAQGREDFGSAQAWFALAVEVEPRLGDGWLYLAQTQLELDHPGDALFALEQGLGAPDLAEVGRSDIFFFLGVIYQQEHEDYVRALQHYGRALRADDFSHPGIKAELFHKRGNLYEMQQRDSVEIISEYRRAIEVFPGNYWARLRLGYMLYWADKDLLSAQTEIQHASTLWPRGDTFAKLPYRYLGDIFVDAGMIDRALAQYRIVLKLDPVDAEVLAMIQSLLSVTTSNLEAFQLQRGR
jgi:tetratricopeptide (TPR) repeat protein